MTMKEHAILAFTSFTPHTVAACCLTASTSNPSFAIVGAGFLEQSTDSTLASGGWQQTRYKCCLGTQCLVVREVSVLVFETSSAPL
jgi:hypothetical protein